jgi:hypothetical protein
MPASNRPSAVAGDSYDNALAEAVIRLFETDVTLQKGKRPANTG